MNRRSIIIAAIALLTLGLTSAADGGSIDITTTGVDITGPVTSTDITVTGPVTADKGVKDTSGNLLTVPPGAIFMFPIEIPPAGYLECDGAEISRTTYAALFAVLGTTYGDGDGSTTFSLPDMRGQFVRGWDHTAGIDPDVLDRDPRGDGIGGDNVGTKQQDQLKTHTHTYKRVWDNPADFNYGGGTPDDPGIWGQTGAYGGTETRPKNIYMMFCIKY